MFILWQQKKATGRKAQRSEYVCAIKLLPTYINHNRVFEIYWVSKEWLTIAIFQSASATGIGIS